MFRHFLLELLIQLINISNPVFEFDISLPLEIMDKTYKESWISRDFVYYSNPPRVIFDEKPSEMFGNKERYEQMLNKYCGFECYIQWKYGNMLICKHNYSCCLTCGKTWIRFATPEDHSMLSENYGCNKSPEDSTSSVLNFYRYVKSLYMYI